MRTWAGRSSLLLLLAAIGLPRPAQACGEPELCDYTNKWVSIYVTTEVVASDGVVLLAAERGRDARAEDLDDAEALAALTAQVTMDGQPITGTLELDAGWAGLVWRPDAPLSPGALLSFTLMVDNESIIDESLVAGLPCTLDNFEVGPVELEVSSTASTGLEAVAASGSHDEVELAHDLSSEGLDSLVCCDGAYPEYNDICGTDIHWTQGYCAWTAGTGRTWGTWALNLDGVSAELTGVLSWRLVTDSEIQTPRPGLFQRGLLLEAATCARVELRNRATNEIVELDEICIGEDVAGQLGPQSLDPSEELAGACMLNDPYVCEHDGYQWDGFACEPWTPGADEAEDAGGGCRIDPSSGRSAPLALGLLVLLGWTRRCRVNTRASSRRACGA